MALLFVAHGLASGCLACQMPCASGSEGLRGSAGVVALSVDHGFRPESAQEASSVGAWCERRQVPFRAVALAWRPGERPKREHLMKEGRRRRYEALGTACHQLGASVVLTGHHAGARGELRGPRSLTSASHHSPALQETRQRRSCTAWRGRVGGRDWPASCP